MIFMFAKCVFLRWFCSSSPMATTTTKPEIMMIKIMYWLGLDGDFCGNSSNVNYANKLKARLCSINYDAEKPEFSFIYKIKIGEKIYLDGEVSQSSGSALASE
jgi:hypothetical protein